MVGVFGEKLFENGAGFLLTGIGLVFYGRAGANRQRIENCGFVIFGIALIDLLHGVSVFGGAIGERARVRTLIEDRDCSNVIALALSIGSGDSCTVNRCPPNLQIRRSWRVP